MKSLSYVYKLFRQCNISGGGLHHNNPFTSAANLPPTASKSTMFLLRRLFESARNLQIHQIELSGFRIFYHVRIKIRPVVYFKVEHHVFIFFQVDVIVNSNGYLNFSNPSAMALLDVAGKELLEECRKSEGLMEGELFSTGPAKLNCKRVYHVRPPFWNNGRGYPVILFYSP